MAKCAGRIRTVLVGAAILLLAACSHPSETARSPAEPPAPAAAPKRPSDPEVRAAQEALAGLGYYRGPIDGIAGPKTQAAVAKYQTSLGLAPDGKVSRDLLAQAARAYPIPGRHDQAGSTGGPLHEIGDAYIYTDGQVETVVSVDKERVEWKNAAGSRWSSARDLALSSSQAESGATTAHHSLAWPLKVGATGTYAVAAASAKPGNSSRGTAGLWQCVVEGRERIAVAAGTFDTYKIVCQPDSGTPDATRSRSWYYAPAVGHYVRYVDNASSTPDDSSGTRSRDLVAISPSVSGWPPEARIGLEWALSHALEGRPDGQPVPWQSSAIAARFVITPGRRVDSDGSAQCRQFALTRTASDGAQRLYPGVACRNASGRWQVPGLDGADRLVNLATP